MREVVETGSGHLAGVAGQISIFKGIPLRLLLWVRGDGATRAGEAVGGRPAGV